MGFQTLCYLHTIIIPLLVSNPIRSRTPLNTPDYWFLLSREPNCVVYIPIYALVERSPLSHMSMNSHKLSLSHRKFKLSTRNYFSTFKVPSPKSEQIVDGARLLCAIVLLFSIQVVFLQMNISRSLSWISTNHARVPARL